MFLKQFKVRTSTAIRGSDRRKLRADVQQSFASIDSDELMKMIPNKEEMAITKITTHSGDMVIFYSVNGEPILFEIEKRIYPTVYCLWNHPRILVLNFTTWTPVFQKLANGADLMLPGVVLPQDGVNSLEPFERDQLCTVTLKGNQSPIAVGVTTVSRKDLFEDGMRGKGVKILHIFTDCLWAHGSKTNPPQIDEVDESEVQNKEVVEDGNSNDIVSGSEEANTEPNNHDTPVLQVQTLTTAETIQQSQEANDHVSDDVNRCQEIFKGVCVENEQQNVVRKSFSLENMDELFEYCFFCAVLRLKEPDIPILTSAFFRNNMLSYCPEGMTLDIKKSTFKKLSKFLHSMQDRGIVVVQELSKGVDSITAVDFSHKELKTFKSSIESLPPKPSTHIAAAGQQGPLIEEMVSVSGSLAKLFADVGYEKGAVFSPSEARKVVTEYIKKNDLVDKNNQRLIILDPTITNAIVNKNEDLRSLTWDNLFSRVMNKMNSCYQITLPGHAPVVKKGKIDSLEMKIEQRMGNKKVTLVRNLDTYGIDPQEFAHKIQLKAASSTSVSQLPGKAAASQVLVQGNQIKIVASALIDDYKIPKKYISGLELLKCKKKK